MCLVFNLPAEFIKILFLNFFRQVLILHHALHIQVFKAYKPWLSVYNYSRRPMYMIGSDVSQPVVDS